jgi:hypothetical protein
MIKAVENSRKVGISYVDRHGGEHYKSREVSSGFNVGDGGDVGCNFNYATGRRSGNAFFNVREKLNGRLGVAYCATDCGDREGVVYVRDGDAKTYKFVEIPLDTAESLSISNGGAVKVVPYRFLSDDGELLDSAEENSFLFDIADEAD